MLALARSRAQAGAPAEPPAPARAVAAPRPPPPDAATLERLAARLAPVDLTADITALPAGERVALARLIEASKLMDALFLRQVWAGNPALLIDLQRDKTPLGRARLHAFMQNKGPWLRLDKDQPFLPGIGPKPAAANFYPAGATKPEIEAWLKKLPRAGARRRGGLLHHHPPHAAGRVAAHPLQRRIPGRAGAGGRAAARGGARHRAADAARVPRDSARPRSCPTTTTTATWRG